MSNSLILDKKCLEIARKQFCLDVGLPWEEYCANGEQRIFICKNKFAASAGARVYAGRSSFFRAIICLGQLFICCDEKIYDWVVEQYAHCKPEWFCDFQNLRKLDEKLREFGHQIQDTHVYFLPESEEDSSQRKSESEACADMQKESATFVYGQGDIEDASEYIWFKQEEILQFKENNRFTSAICFWEGTPDVLAVAAMREGCTSVTVKSFDQSQMAGMAGASRDGEYLWQIGINIDKDYAGQGLGHKLVRALKEEILFRGKVPFYGTSESHTVSQTVGLKAGFVPAWTEVWAKEVKENS